MKKTLFLALAVLVFFLPQITSPFFPALAKRMLHGTLEIEKTSLSWYGPQTFKNIAFSDDELIVEAKEFFSPLPFWKIGSLKKSFTLKDTSLNYGNAKITNLNVTVSGDEVNASGSTSQGGIIEVEGKATSSKDFDLQANLQKVPTLILDRLMNGKGLLKILGNTIDLQGTYTSEGKVTASISSPMCLISLNGRLQRGELTLIDPLKIDLFISDLNVKQLQIRGQTPISCTIFPEEFRLPIKDFKKIQINRAELNLGKLQVIGSDSLQSLLTVFGTRSNTIDFWFTPVDFSLKNEVLRIGRIDALLERSIHLCLFGDINFRRDSLDMTLGIPRDTLIRSFDLQAIGENYVLKVPVSGSIDKPKLDLKPSIAKIAAMKAAESVPSARGRVFGGLINIFTQNIDGDDDPEPNRPFPWER